MDATLQGIFQAQFEQFIQTHALSYKHYQAANAIMACEESGIWGQYTYFIT